MVGVAAKDGKFLWRYDKAATTTNATTPVYRDGYVFESLNGPGPGLSALLELTADGKRYNSAVLVAPGSVGVDSAGFVDCCAAAPAGAARAAHSTHVGGGQSEPGADRSIAMGEVLRERPE